MIKNEFGMLRKNKLLLIVLIAIILIPSIYAGIFLSSMWDPYGELKKLPVAVVNLDKPVEYNGKTLAIGNAMEETLLNNKTMAFKKETKKQAETGLQDGTYYMVITIPEDFSQNAATLTAKEPKKMVLSYETNPGKNYISSKLSESAMKEIKNSITSEVTRTYAQATFEQLSDIGNGLQQAADGTTDIANGEQKLVDGSNEIKNNLEKLKNGAAQLNSGANALQQGIISYTDGASQLKDGMDALEAGVGKISDGTTALQQGSEQLYNGMLTASDALNKSLTEENIKNMQTAEDGLLSLNDGIQQLNVALNGDGVSSAGMDMGVISNALVTVGDNIKNTAEPLNTGAQMLVGNYAQSQNMEELGGCAGDIMSAYKMLAVLLQSDSSLSPSQQLAIKSAMDLLADQTITNPNTAMGKALIATGNIGAAGKELQSAGNVMSQLAQTDMNASVVKLKESVAALSGAAAKLLPASSQAITSLRTGMQQIQTGFNQTEAQAGSSGLLEGMAKLKTGICDLNNGVSGNNGLVESVGKITKGAESLVSNNKQLVDGAALLCDGTNQASAGAAKLLEGSGQLNDGLLTLQEGTLRLNASLQSGADAIAENGTGNGTLDMFSEPVTVQETQITKVENNGHAMAAYMMSVGLWVGCLAFCLMYPLMHSTGKITNGLAWWSSKAVIAYPVAIFMAVALMAILSVANGFKPDNMMSTFGVAALAAVSFMSVMYFFNVLLGKVGSFLMLIFMVFQLAGSAGTYPIEISGTLAEKLHPYVPFTYSVEAFRSTIAGGRGIETECTVLIVLAVIFTLLTVCVFQYRGRRLEKGQFIFYEWLEQNGLA